ncbi:MAG: hypothetical protein P857_739 [Candidatus Xenolissoclinum pacificiensis L6]|uniref:Uncharacterized protein n=1 Tax=Candidatus Xenolissoclinum pacificiensis L6 TaxID=1401685 RepID=W2UZH7_9RICK|nr:MAG: hypothetical protein P857_739 [Candidatus Xenolissoclinum pacificiensis L6]
MIESLEHGKLWNLNSESNILAKDSILSSNQLIVMVFILGIIFCLIFTSDGQGINELSNSIKI